MSLKDKVFATIEKHSLIENGQHIVLGLSGGPDSLVLFYLLKELAEDKDVTIHAVHVNHMLRGEDADRDQLFCEELCRAHGINLKTVVVDCKMIAEERGISTEEAGRMVRYSAFFDEAIAISATGIAPAQIRIAVAHHADDQVETVLFRMIRGTGTDGLAGMDYIRMDKSGFALIRPMLDIWKSEILSYCYEQGLDPCIDHTNSQNIYTRNRIRLDLIPELQKYNVNVKDAVLRLSRVAASDRDYFRKKTAETYERVLVTDNGGMILLDGPMLRAEEPSVRKRVIMEGFRRAGLAEDISFRHMEAADAIVLSDDPSARSDMPRGFYICKVYEDVRIASEDAVKKLSREGGQTVPELSGETEDGGAAAGDAALTAQAGAAVPSYKYDIAVISTEAFYADYLQECFGKMRGAYAAFDADLVEADYGRDFRSFIEWRSRRNGDRISVRTGAAPAAAEAGGAAEGAGAGVPAQTTAALFTKKIQDLFVDEKVPRDLRDSVMMAAIGRDVLFIPERKGVWDHARYSPKYNLCETTKKVLLIARFVEL